MSGKINVAVLMGGRTAEHDVSLASGRMIVEALDKSKYNVKAITITKEGKWLIPHGYIGQVEDRRNPVDTLPHPGESVRQRGLVPLGTGRAITRTLSEKVDVVFIAMHGPYGEDGVIQGLLEAMEVPYTGSDVAASSLAMDKVRCNDLLSYHGILTPRHIVFDEHAWRSKKGEIVERAEAEFGYPCVAKVPRLGSSIGMVIPENREEFETGIDEVLRYDSEVMVEEHIAGREITCSVLGNSPGMRPIPLPLTEIVPKTSEYFDYEAKYTPGASEEITPARISEDLTRKAQEIGVRVHEILGCGGLSRTDMIVKGEDIYVLETNTIPGMTPVSLYPQAAAAAGMSFSELLDRLIELALEAHQRKKKFYDIR